MVGLVTSREPIRGEMARQLLEHMARRTAQRQAGELKCVRPVRKSKLVIAEDTNE